MHNIFRQDPSRDVQVLPRNITGHLERLIREGRDIDIDRIIDSSKHTGIEKVFLTMKTWSLGPVVDHFNGTVSFGEAKLVRAYMQRNTPESFSIK
ncbi:MAG TPA: hypothetical protein ENH30_05905 [Nitrospirae bacterium]|nr:hypothetical protein [Nitrospirota bacterium]